MGVGKTAEGETNKLNKSNSVEVYVPPALRKSLETPQLDCDNNSRNGLKDLPVAVNKVNEGAGNSLQTVSSTIANRQVRRERRPDRAVYIPRARRSLTTPPQVNATSHQSTTSTISQSNKYSNLKQITSNHKCSKVRIEADSQKEGNRSTTDSASVKSYCDSDNGGRNKYTNEVVSELITTDSKIEKGCDKVNTDFKLIGSTNIETNNIINMNHTAALENIKENKPQDTALRIEDATSSKAFKGDNDFEELERASKEINRCNRRIIKQTFNSSILEIPQNLIKDNMEDQCKTNSNSEKPKEIDPEKDDWDSMFDDNGECIDPKILEELTASVGKVKIEKPRADYSAYHLKQSILSEEEFPHVLEVSNFPVEFKTQDLMMIFSTYKESGFDIKWVDDTHALAVFSSSRIAAEVLAMGHPFVLLKPLAEATVESRTKARKCSSSLQPYRPRPETCAALARRLVTGALGVRLKTAPEERENEKRVLKEAKERKLLAARQRDEAWES